MRALTVAAIASAALLLGSCGDPSAPATDAARPTLSLPSGAGPLIDPSMTKEAFEKSLREVGSSVEQLVADDSIYVDIGPDVSFTSREETGKSLSHAQLVGGYTVLDDVVVVTFSAGWPQCVRPVTASARLADDHIEVDIQLGELTTAESCPEAAAVWRATFVVPGARHGTPVRQSGSTTTLAGVAPPLLENLEASLIYADMIPR